MNTLKATIKWIIAIVVICLAAYFLASINGLSVSRDIASVNGNKLTQAEYKYYLEMTKAQMLTEANAASEDEFWKSEIDGEKATEVAKARAMDELIRMEIGVQKAKELGITLTEDELATAHAYVNADDAASKEQIKSLEKATGADKFQLAEIMERVYLSGKYFQYVSDSENSPIVVDDAAVSALVKEDYAAVKHVLIMNAPADGSTPSDTEQYAADAKKKAEEVLAKAQNGENFEALIEEYGEDPGMEGNAEGYLIDKNGTSVDGTGSMIPEFTQGTFAVKPGEVNPALVESTYGFHIIKRYPVSETSELYQSMLAMARNQLSTEAYNAYLDGFKDQMNIEIKENVYKSIKVK